MLRPYQNKALGEIFSYYKSGTRRVLLVMPTGSGKSVVMAEAMKRFAAEGKRSFMVTRGRKLISQYSARLKREGVRHSVIMAGSDHAAADSFVTLGSIDTVHRRKLCPEADLLVIDEAHLALSDAFFWLYEQYPTANFLSLTATPFAKQGFRALADVIVAPIDAKKLIAEGYLVPARYYTPAQKLDLSTVKKSGGEYVRKDLDLVVNQSRLFGDVVESWKRYGESRPSLLFAVSVSHSKRLCEAFNAAGVPSLHVDAECPEDVRQAALDALEAGMVKVVCSVGTLITGVDLPCVSCLILCRPTLSQNIYLQSLGRGTRPAPGKRDFIVLDHADCVARFGFYDDARPYSIEGKPLPFRAVTRTCSVCFCTFKPTLDQRCPGLFPDGSTCGNVNEVKPPKPREIKADDRFELVELSPEEKEKRDREKWITDCARDAAERGHKPGAAFFKVKARYGDAIARGAWSLIHSVYREQV